MRWTDARSQLHTLLKTFGTEDTDLLSALHIFIEKAGQDYMANMNMLQHNHFQDRLFSEILDEVQAHQE